MAVEYQVRKNPLVKDSDSFAATVVTAGSAGLEQIADRIASQGTTVGRADCLAVLENILQATNSLLQEGFRVQLGGIVDLFPRIKGNFDGFSDTYDPSRHQVDVAAMPGIRLRNSFHREAAVKKTESRTPAPNLAAFSQKPQAQQPQTITTGNIGTIDGSNLKFDPASEDEGIFLVNTDGTESYKVEIVQENRPKQVVFLIPEIAEGKEYFLEVRSRHRGGTQLRTGRFDKILTS